MKRMKKNRILMLFKGLLGIFAFVFISMGYLDIAKANTSVNYVDVNTQITMEAGKENIDVNALMAALEGKDLKDGGDYVLNDEYNAHVEITMEEPSSSTISLMSVTNNYIATCNVYIYHSGTNTHVATITHSVNITYNDSGLVHINSGSVSASTLVSYISGYAYGYNITNTDGSYSSAYGMLQLYDSSTSLYYYYGCGVKVYRSETPIFDFSQV
jgi:hypothetical protein